MSQISVQYINGEVDSFETTSESDRILDLKQWVKDTKTWSDELEKVMTSVVLIDQQGAEVSDDTKIEEVILLKLEPLQVCFKIPEAECSSHKEAAQLGIELKDVQVIRIPAGVDRILCRSFGGCSMRKVIIPASVQIIEAAAFKSCSQLEVVTFESSASLSSIGRAAFQWCKNLKHLELPDDLSHIEAEAFYGCESLSQVKLPKFCRSIGQSALEYCTSLCEIDIPDTLTYLGPAVFRCCPFKSLKIPESITQIESCLCQDCYDLESVELPESLTIIGAAAFEDCPNLSMVNIPAGLQRIEDCAFEGTALMDLKLPPGCERM